MAAKKVDAGALSVASLQQWLFDLQVWVSSHWVQILISALAGFIVYCALVLLRGIARRIAARPSHLVIAVVIAKALSRTGQVFMIMASAKLVAGYAHPPEPVSATISFLFTVSAVFQVALWVRDIVLGLIERRASDEGHGETITNAMGIIRLLVSIALFAIAAVMVLDNVGVNVTGLVAGLGIGGIAIGLAAQGIFSDLFAALSIIFDRPFRIGETIRYDQTTGVVEAIGLKSTRLRAISGEKKIISNADLLKKEITSFHDLDHRRVKFVLPVLYDVDPDKAAALPDMFKQIVAEEGGRYIRSGLVNFGANGLEFELEFDVFKDSWDEIYAIRHRIGLAVLRRLRQENLGFAYAGHTTPPAQA